ncbi:MAG: carbohydrate-binding domain-containing protein [Bauldia sp.]
MKFLTGVSTLALSATLLAAVATAQPAPNTTTITLGATTVVDGSGATATADGVTITESGVYTISGTIADGMITVDAPGAAVELVLAGADITNADGPAIIVRDASDATVTLAAGTQNSLADGGESEFDAALYSTPSLTIGGEGALTVDATYEGISSEMHITFTGGEVRVHAAEDAVNANNDGVSIITISGGYVFVDTEAGDGIDSNGTIVITGGTVIALGALADMNSGLDADGGVTIDGGTVIATGSSGIGMTRIAGAQETISTSLASVQTAGTVTAVLAGTEPLLVFAPTTDFQSVVFSSPALADGVTYDILVGGTPAGAAVDGLYGVAGYAGGTAVATATTAAAGGFTGGPGFGTPPAR